MPIETCEGNLRCVACPRVKDGWGGEVGRRKDRASLGAGKGERRPRDSHGVEFAGDGVWLEAECLQLSSILISVVAAEENSACILV